MARALNKLTVRGATALSAPGRHTDGGGLYLDITAAGSKSWVFLFRSPVHRTTRQGKPVGRMREMGLGAFGTDQSDRVSLAQARAFAEDARRLIKSGVDPLDERNKPDPVVVRIPTFGELADQYIAAMESQWRNDKHKAQWRATLQDHAKGLRSRPVNAITVDHVLSVLQPIWLKVPETAGRLRGRIERILDAAKAAGHRTGENPAAWRGHLENLLPKRHMLSRGHHKAMRWADVPDFVSRLREREGVAAFALEFLIMSAVRSGEARGALWDEIDLAANVWTVPANRMKAGKPHRVPLTGRMLAILDTVKPLRRADDLVFPSLKPGRPLSDMTLAAVLKRMKVTHATVHGFRSAFRDWCGEATSFPREIAEEALAHTVGSAVERAYRRGDALERRRELMEAWAAFCQPQLSENVLLLPVRSSRAMSSTDHA